MKFITVKDYEQLSNVAADIIAAQIIMKPHCVLGLATGSTPVGTYKRLAEKVKAGEIDQVAIELNKMKQADDKAMKDREADKHKNDGKWYEFWRW